MYSKMIPLYTNDEVGNYRCGWCGQIFIEMSQLKDHIKSSNEDLLNTINCNIGFIRIAGEVKELIRPDDDYSNDELTMEVFERTKSIFHHCTKVIENKIETIDRENGPYQKKIHLESPIKLYCHKCSKELGTQFEAYDHQRNEHGIEDFSTEEMKEMIVDDATNYGDEIELENIGLYIIGKSENFLTQLGKYIFQNRKCFRKFLNDQKLRTNFVVDVKLNV
jgi:hypothetical protein